MRFTTIDLGLGYGMRPLLQDTVDKMARDKWPYLGQSRTPRRVGMSMTMDVAIVGWQYRKGADGELARLQRHFESAGSVPRLFLRRELDNPHDPNAIRVTSRKGVWLGYVPRADAALLARIMDGGVMVRASFNGGKDMKVWYPASTKEGVDEAYRRAMAEGEGL